MQACAIEIGYLIIGYTIVYTAYSTWDSINVSLRLQYYIQDLFIYYIT